MRSWTGCGDHCLQILGREPILLDGLGGDAYTDGFGEHQTIARPGTGLG